MQDERSNEAGRDSGRAAERHEALRRLTTEHGKLNHEWTELQAELTSVHDRLDHLIANPNVVAGAAEIDALTGRLDAVHGRQREVLDRQDEIEKEIVRLLRDL